MRILIDALSSQVQVQFQGYPPQAPSPERRLNTLLGAMRSGGTSLLPVYPNAEWQICYSCAPITAAQLAGVNVFFVMTHHPVSHTPNDAYTWSPDELDAIEAFVEQGGALLLMSNHAPYPLYDAALAAKFGVTLQNVFVSNPAGWLTMSGDLLNQADYGNTFLFGVDSLAAHDGCAISAATPPMAGGGFTWLAQFPEDAGAPQDSYFAAHITWGQGQAIFVANSGIVGDYGGNPDPACGGIASGSNLMFTLNCLRLLGGQPQASKPGSCPGGQG
jgi:hypothetical protein